MCVHPLQQQSRGQHGASVHTYAPAISATGMQAHNIVPRKLGMLHRTDLQTSNLSLLPQHPSLIELKLLALQDVPIAATALSRARADACIQTTSGKLVIQMLV